MKGTIGEGWKKGEEKRTKKLNTPKDTCSLLYNTELGQCYISVKYKYLCKNMFFLDGDIKIDITIIKYSNT